jgi:Fe2+ or Zn2+ uptake regulation protein
MVPIKQAVIVLMRLSTLTDTDLTSYTDDDSQERAVINVTDVHLSRETLGDAARRFEACGHRATPQRLAVVAVLMAQRGHITAQALHAALRRIQPHVGLATVYRTLDLLVDCGLAQPFPQPNNEVRYAFCSARHHHHLVCTGCGSVEEVSGCTLQAIERDLERERHFAIAEHALTFFGTCRDCQGPPPAAVAP